MSQFNVGERVRHREDDRIGEVYGVHPQTVWVLWGGFGTPQNTMPSNLIPVRFLEGDRVKSKEKSGLRFLGTVLGLDDSQAWVKMSNGSYITLQQDLLELG